MVWRSHLPCKEMRVCPQAPVGVTAPRPQPPKNIAGLVMHGQFATNVTRTLLLAPAGAQEGSCTDLCVAQCSPQGPHSRAGHEPQQPSVRSQPVFYLSEPTDHCHHSTEDYSGSLLLLEEAQPQLGQCPPAACPPPEGAGDGSRAQK